MKLKNILIGAVIGFISAYILIIFCVILVSFVLWLNFFEGLSIVKERAIFRTALIFSLIGAVVGGFIE